ncbi:DUF2314 domain-containing protein [Pseudomarimonas arenosa]|uniref:DUF2314 domain-containing protein n=1 Tax=Pseudomarimonas arenosa TaxID=2774145 RepID=A0AAW3ZUV4_9GAMM|nr:DUF2314 domain-containing protein [Pseudomarimonas arenosa]MBD8528097.1 DUF2314 domain-containing protein [Pseudomarimonas arenosa]
MLLTTAVLVLLVSLLLYWWLVARNRPAIAPLAIDQDDPLMTEAIAQARAGLGQFRRLLDEHPRAGSVKLPFDSNSGETEFIWAEVKLIEDDQVEVLYSTPPVSHSGRIERQQRHPLSDIVDWVVELPGGMRRGGYTMRVMFQRAREQWGKLPAELQAEEEKYLWS